MTDTTKKVRTLPDGTKVTQTEHPFVGLPEADERLAKVKIASEINRLLKKKGLTEISNLNRGRLSGFTFYRLYRCLNAFDVDVEITIKKHPARSKVPAGVHILPV